MKFANLFKYFTTRTFLKYQVLNLKQQIRYLQRAINRRDRRYDALKAEFDALAKSSGYVRPRPNGTIVGGHKLSTVRSA